jgi:hypothetical protein
MESNGEEEEGKIGRDGQTIPVPRPWGCLRCQVALMPTASHWCIRRFVSLPDIGLQGGNYSTHGANSNGHGDETRRREKS